MPSKKFTINDTQDILTLSYGLYYSSMKVLLNDQEIGTIASRSDLKQGREFTLSSGAVVFIQLITHWYSRRSELHILIDGKPLKGSMADPYMQVNRIFRFMLIIGAISVISGLSSLGVSSALKSLDIDQNQVAITTFMKSIAIVNLCIGTGFVLLAFATRQLFVNAVYAAMVLLVISISLRIYITYQYTAMGGAAFGLVVRLLYLAILWRGAEAIKKIKAEEGV